MTMRAVRNKTDVVVVGFVLDLLSGGVQIL